MMYVYFYVIVTDLEACVDLVVVVVVVLVMLLLLLMMMLTIMSMIVEEYLGCTC